MNNRNMRFIGFLVVLIVFSLACNAITGAEPQEPTVLPSVSVETTKPATASPAPTEIIPTEPVVDAPTSYESDFPLPGDVQNFLALGDKGINYQTGMAFEDVIAFYRGAFSAEGLRERKLLTVISEDVFSLVFDGSPNGKAVVLQGVLLDTGSVNVNIRYEDT